MARFDIDDGKFNSRRQILREKMDIQPQKELPKTNIINTPCKFKMNNNNNMTSNCTCNNKCDNNVCKSKIIPQKEIILTQKNIESGSIILKESAYYRFGSDLQFRPTALRQAAITIAASGVVLDLGKYTLLQGNTTPLTYGILVSRDSERVKITGEKNVASIKNFTLAGIRVLGRTNIITIENIVVQQTTPQQLTNEQIPSSCANILDLRLNLGIAVGEGDTFGEHMRNTSKENLVTNLSITDVIVDGATIGIQIIFTFGMELLRSLLTRNTYYGVLIGTGWLVPGNDQNGLTFPTAANGIVKDCRFEHNYGFNVDLSNPEDTFVFDFVSALAFNEVTNYVVEDCIVHDNFNDGFIIAIDHDGSNNMVFRNTHITQTRSIFEPADALHFSGSIPFSIGPCVGVNYPLIQDFNISIDNCSGNGSSSQQGRASGILLAFAQGARVSNCTCIGNSGRFSFGFVTLGQAPGGVTSAITFDNCVAERNGEIDGSIFGGGFCLTRSLTDCVVINNCVSNKNITASTNVTGGGILVLYDRNPLPNAFRNIDIDKCVVKCNGNGTVETGGIIILNDVATQNLVNVAIQKSSVKFNNGDGIFIGPNVVGASINETEIYQNTLNGIDISTANNPVFVSRNVAFANNVNYKGVNPANILVGTVNNLPANVGMLNVSITA